MRVLVLNAGSSTLKASVLDTPAHEPLASRTVSWGSDATAVDRSAAIRDVLDGVHAAGVSPSSIEAVGHRVVHGGTRFVEPVLADAAIAEAIEALADLAPLHNAAAAATLRAGLDVLSGIPHVGVFDTAFHATLPPAGYRYPVPGEWYERWGIRRFGFHGLSVEWSVRRTSELVGRPVDELRLIVAHLGSGCSVTAVDGGRSVDTSMGLTPLEGLMMGTRAGSIDPGIVFNVLGRGLAADRLEADLEHRSGLLGVAGSQDVRELLARAAGGDKAATLALELFVRRAAAGIAAAATALPALDALVFTGGIGENATLIRRRICERLAVLGVAQPGDAADDEDAVLGREADRPLVVRVHAREDVVIAEAAAGLIGRLPRS